MAARPIVVDANILIRYVIGTRVEALLTAYAATIDFLAPDTAFDEARRHLPGILRSRGDTGFGVATALLALDAVTSIVTPVQAFSYTPLRRQALARIGRRDPDDWPVLACALLLNCPIWTEDRDFFGTGVATWTTALVGLYFAEPDPGMAPQ
jgi:predicted nucleic acid-binding protein